ncbi:hypothetical protein F4859DRAFT_468089 [Xylaria cf. heliscus]|nr:hypothetical protein F4859DRAFT_468089 [Xylaria cf. heliscus]
MATQSTDDQLVEEAELGKLPFDLFALEKWDYTQPAQQDQEQWDRLALEWLHLDARGRHPYHGLDDAAQSHNATATADQMNRVLVPHQTIRERNLSVRTEMGRYSPVWLRTCYSPELASVYTEWRTSVDLESVLGHWSQILDDEALYASFAANWSRVLLRVPAIADTVRYAYETDSIMRDVSEDYEPPGEGEEFKMPLYEAMIKEKTMLFLVDEEALRDKLIKVLWLDIHGTCVWDNRLPPEKMLDFKGRMFDGGSLATLSEDFEDDAEVYERGSVLDIN